MKTASHDEVIAFVKRQNKHIRELENLLDRLETRHKEYKTQLRDYATQVQSLRSLEHIQGDDGLKQQLQALLVERDALAAELAEKQAAAAPSEPSSPSPPTSQAEETPSISKEELDRMRGALEVTKKNFSESAKSAADREERLKNTIESQQRDIAKFHEQLSQANTACEALKSRLSHVSTQHASKLQGMTAEHESKLQTLSATIAQLQRDLDISKEAQGRLEMKIAPSSDAETNNETQGNEENTKLKEELENLKRRLEELQKERESAEKEKTKEPSSVPVSIDVSENPLDTSLVSKKEAESKAALEALCHESEQKSKQISQLEEKLQSKHSLLVKAHKHLGELTAQLADANIRAQQLQSEKQRLELSAATLTELRQQNAKLQESLEHSHTEFEQYKAKVLAAESEKKTENTNGSETTSTTSIETTSVIQEKLDDLNSEVSRLRDLNERLRSEKEVADSEISNLHAKTESAANQLRHYKERDASRGSSSEKHQKVVEALEEKHKAALLEISTQSDAAAANSSAQISRLRSKADEAIKQRDAEISTLKDMIEVLKLQISQTPSSKPISVMKATEMSSETSRRRVSSDIENFTSSTHTGAKRKGTEANFSSLASQSSSSSIDAAHSDSNTIEDQSNQIQTLLARMGALQSQVSELEQLLALSREQEQFLKLELRRTDRTSHSTSTSSLNSSSNTPSTPSKPGTPLSSATFPTISANDYVVLRNLLKAMLETSEIPNIAVFADLLRLTSEELQQVQSKASGTARVASVVESGVSAIWNMFGSPQR